MEMSNDEFVGAVSGLVKIHANIKRMGDTRSRLKELGWENVSLRELEKMKDQDPDTVFYEAFEHATMGIRYCYSEQDVTAFLEQLEAHSRTLKELSGVEYKRLMYGDWVDDEKST